MDTPSKLLIPSRFLQCAKKKVLLVCENNNENCESSMVSFVSLAWCCTAQCCRVLVLLKCKIHVQQIGNRGVINKRYRGLINIIGISVGE